MVGQIAAELGQPLMPWQQHVADVALEFDPDTRRLHYRDVVLTVPRQSGKSTLILALLIQRALLYGSPQRMAYAAQTRLDAKKKLIDDWLPLIEGSPFAELMRPLRSTGEESYRWDNGSITHIVANTEKSGHGATLDLAFVDEAFSQVDDRMEQAFSPAMITRPEPQMWVVSTAGTADSIYLNGKVALGRTSLDDPQSRVAFFEWSAEPDADPGSPETWRGCMPALGHTVTEDAVAAEFEKMNLAEFKRAYLNIPTVNALHEPVIDLDLWAELDDYPNSMILGRVSFGVDVTPDRSAAAIAVAGARQDGLEHVEVVQHFSGTQGVVERLVELHAAHAGVVTIDPTGAAGSLLPELEKAQVPVELVGMREMVAACGGFYDAVVQKRVRHIGNPELNAALVSARKRDLAGAWAWQKRDSGDICPLVAVTLAHYAHTSKVEELPPLIAYR